METKSRKFLFESETCSRCGGSGHYSYCQMHGTVCFKCGGAGVTLTKRGKIAQAWFTARRSKRASDVKVGDVIWVDHAFMKAHWAVVESMSVQNTTYHIRTKGCDYGACADTMIKIRFPTAEARDTAIAAALAYQTTLTKLGKPRVRAPISRADLKREVIEREIERKYGGPINEHPLPR